MERFEVLETEIAAATRTIGEAVALGTRTGFQGDAVAVRLLAALAIFKCQLEVCMAGPVTEEYLEQVLIHCGRLLPLITAALRDCGPVV